MLRSKGIPRIFGAFAPNLSFHLCLLGWRLGSFRLDRRVEWALRDRRPKPQESPGAVAESMRRMIRGVTAYARDVASFPDYVICELPPLLWDRWPFLIGSYLAISVHCRRTKWKRLMFKTCWNMRARR